MKDNDIEKLKELINSADAIVVGGAAGMSAASGFKFYYQDDDVFRMLAGGLADKYGFKNMFDDFYDSRLTDRERWALVLRTIKYIYMSVRPARLILSSLKSLKERISM